jgi:T4 beta protein
MTNPTQLRLTRSEWFRPVPEGIGHYVPVLQSQPGERDALAKASPQTWEHMTPLIVILGPKKRETEPFNPDRIAEWVKKVAAAVDAHPCFLDTLRVRGTDRVRTAGGTCPVLDAIYAQACNREMQFVPVLRVHDPTSTVKQIRDAVERDGRGVAVRYPLLDSASADDRGLQALIKEALHAVGVDVVGADLLLDLGFLDPDVEINPDVLQTSIDHLVAVGAWRSVVLIGTGMHRSLGGGVVPEGTVGRLPRREWDLWRALRTRQQRRLPTYGDYAVQHPDPPWEGEGSGPGMRANIRYTLEDITVVPRGLGPFQQEGAEQYRRLCQKIIAEPEFAGPDYTWGDRLIDDCARAIGDPGNQNRWRGAGTSHHLRLVVEQLARLR